MIHAVAIDDEPLALQAIAGHAAKLDFLVADKLFTNAAAGLTYLSKAKADVLFLDIKMPDKNGLDIAAQLPKEVQIIFTTAYADYAIKGFELDVTDYLLKPISLTRFTQACNKVRERLSIIKEEKELFFKDKGIWHKVAPAQLLYAEAQGNYMKLFAKNGTYMVRQTLLELAQGLPTYFVKTHKSYLINTRCIDRLELHQVTIGFSNIPVSEYYRKDLFNILGLKNNQEIPG